MIKELTTENFDATVAASSVHVVRFWAEWCGPCRTMSPTFEATAQDLAEEADFGEINVDHSPELAHRFGVQGIPAVLLFKGGKLVDRMVGAGSKTQLTQFIARHRE